MFSLLLLIKSLGIFVNLVKLPSSQINIINININKNVYKIYISCKIIWLRSFIEIFTNHFAQAQSKFFGTQTLQQLKRLVWQNIKQRTHFHINTKKNDLKEINYREK